ncbi:aminotransferase class I/II-fold pyridoxal phosphate-dependent enzyme (plasmid) [Streptosporangium sp. NBC_01495]|uniref:DegT/DnrJ/EryC1/StrS family aminotransferase n=1 Tax=Streptosporangium sp. NBC_01495 TaxID=2903899 RepID=UPI002E33B638|nr:aminotransferase class I/II-fold pyridoxal phosphate-dependent enzyme [Streptosporangium sp. NBC_01495]
MRWPAEPALGGWYTDEEHAAVIQVLTESADWRIGFRAKEHEVAFETAFAHYIGAREAVAVNGGGTGLDMVLECLKLRPGDEIISCAINFVGTHVSVLRRGAQLVVCEPDPLTLNIDPADAERVISPRTRAIVVTHMNGLAADLEALAAVAVRHPHPTHGPPVIIGDAARACGATYNGARVGGQGWASIFSFQSKKPMTTLGQGGMVTTNDPALAKRLRRLRSFGKNQDLGTNYKMTKAQAAVGLVQLRRLDAMNQARIDLARHRSAALRAALDSVGGAGGVLLPPEPGGFGHLYYRYNLLLPPSCAARERDEVIATLASRFGVGCIVADPPTYRTHPRIAEHLSGRRCPVADQVADRLFCPSLHPLMSPQDNSLIADAIAETLIETLDRPR